MKNTNRLRKYAAGYKNVAAKTFANAVIDQRLGLAGIPDNYEGLTADFARDIALDIDRILRD